MRRLTKYFAGKSRDAADSKAQAWLEKKGTSIQPQSLSVRLMDEGWVATIHYLKGSSKNSN